jgi:uncharacterized protein YecE (DUF72 family)
MSIRIGCGSWTDDAYVGLLYPRGQPKTARLRLYASWFERIELNSSYYNIPTAKVVAGWLEQTPSDFLFDVKLHKDFSTDPRGSAAGPQLGKLIAAIQPLADAKRLAAFLWTLPPSFGPKRHRLDELDAIAEKLGRYAPIAVELRDRAWVQGDALTHTLEYFRARKLVWVSTDVPPVDAPRILPPIDEVTNPQLAYLRLHGRNPHYPHAKTAAEGHHYDYSASELQEIAARIRQLSTRAENVHVSANNHAENFAPKAALALRRLLGQPVPPPLAPEGDQDGGQLSLLDG